MIYVYSFRQSGACSCCKKGRMYLRMTRELFAWLTAVDVVLADQELHTINATTEESFCSIFVSMAQVTATEEHLNTTVRQRIQNVTKETAKLYTKSISLQNEMQSLKERNLFLEAELNQKDLTIQSLIHITPHSNQKEEECANSINTSEDERVEEYEKQVKDLFTEIEQLKQENQAIYECLQEQKQAKTKALKAYKMAKVAVKRFQDSGYPALLADLQSKYQALENRAEKLDEMLENEKSKAQCLRSELEAVQREKKAFCDKVDEKEGRSSAQTNFNNWSAIVYCSDYWNTSEQYWKTFDAALRPTVLLG